MKNKKINYLKNMLLLFVVMCTSFSCERELTDDKTPATFSKKGEIFTDDFIALGSDFYLPYGDSKFTAFSVDRTGGYNSNASIRLDVPNATDPLGSYAGGIFRIDGAGRNLTEFDALTFWAKASQGVTVAEFGFGEDFLDNKFITTMRNVSVGTGWTKYTIPIPNASKLLQERGMFRYSMGTNGTNGGGYTVWIDELKFEKLGTVAHGQISIMNGTDVSESTFVGVSSGVEGIQATFNLANGVNQPVSISPAYLDFVSSNPSVASVDELGSVTSLSPGISVITANFGDITVLGSLTINCAGNYINAPTPTRNPANVISIFSDAYNNVPVNYYNGYWAPWQTTVSNDFSVGNDNVLNYTIFNFVGIEFSSPTINAAAMTGVHLDAFIPGAITPGRQLRVLVVDFGADGVFGGGDDTRHSTIFTASTPTAVVSQSWISIDIPFSAMPNLTSRTHLAQLILEGGDASVIYVDNIYFYN
ncbi:Ig-like domain-containing protein [Flavobacterium sp. SM2513]|uniref:Ig-like domain-containing protein n=1 Tax=Flavobacterium sp. SM2513 TaxID=3424766 RepID=UPI003D7FEA95